MVITATLGPSSVVRDDAEPHAVVAQDLGQLDCTVEEVSQTKINFWLRTSSGYEVTTTLTPDQAKRAEKQLLILSGGCPNFDINLSTLISKKPGTEEGFHHSADKAIQELIGIYREALGVKALALDQFIADQRSSRSGSGQLYVRRGTVLTNFRVNKNEDRFDVLKQKSLTTKADLTPAEKRLINSSVNVGSVMPDRIDYLLDLLEKNIRSQLKNKHISPLEANERLRRLETVSGNFKTMNQGAILLEALYPVDMSNMSHEEKEIALKEKERRILELIKAQPEPAAERKPFSGIKYLAQYIPFIDGKSKDSHFDEDKVKFAKDAALSGIETRKDFHVYGNGKPMSGELFFIRLQSLVAKGAPEDEMKELVTSSIFGLAFGDLHVKDQLELQDLLLSTAVRLRDICNDIQDSDAQDAFDKAFKEKFDLKFPKAEAPAQPAVPVAQPVVAQPAVSAAPPVTFPDGPVASGPVLLSMAPSA